MISLVVPTRGRPDRFTEMWESATATATGDIEVITRLDEDDETRWDYPNSGLKIIGSRIVLSKIWNRAAQFAKGDLLMMAADDLIFRTPGWDQEVQGATNRYPDGIAMVHVNDGFQNDAIATHPIITRRWYEVIGMMCPPYFTADFNDVWLHEVAAAIDRKIYLPEVLVEHMHPDAGKAAFDVTYQEQRYRRDHDNPAGTYADMAQIRGEWVDKLREAMWVPEPSPLSTE